jgi:hypothetical protein
MADKKISQLTASTTPLAGTEVLPIVQSGATKKVSVADLTAGRDISARSVNVFGAGQIGPNGAAGYSVWNVGSTNLAGMFYGISDEVQFVNASGLNLMKLKFNDVELQRGNLVIGTSGKGIDFSADGQAAGMTSELLDDYEEGTWTPEYFFDGGGTVTHGTRSGSYVKVGQFVLASATIRSTGVSGVSGNLYVSGLPFTSNSSTGNRNAASIGFMRSWQSDMPNFRLYLQANISQMTLWKNTTDAASSAVTTADFSTGADNNVLEFCIAYRAA